MGIKRNAAKCENCGETVESKSQHDWVCCSCWSEDIPEGETPHGIFVDGGRSYCRHGWRVESEYKQLIEWTEDDETRK